MSSSPALPPITGFLDFSISRTWAQLQAAQFPPTLTDAHGTFHKPPTW